MTTVQPLRRRSTRCSKAPNASRGFFRYCDAPAITFFYHQQQNKNNMSQSQPHILAPEKLVYFKHSHIQKGSKKNRNHTADASKPTSKVGVSRIFKINTPVSRNHIKTIYIFFSNHQKPHVHITRRTNREQVTKNTLQTAKSNRQNVATAPQTYTYVCVCVVVGNS